MDLDAELRATARAHLARLLPKVLEDGHVDESEKEQLLAVFRRGILTTADVREVFSTFLKGLTSEVMADGVQVYSCEPKDQAFAWTFKAPEANLFDEQGVQVGAHFAGPSWKFSDATIVGEVLSRADAPEKGAIPWLLLKTKSHDGTGAVARGPCPCRICTDSCVSRSWRYA